jgi:uncharacterized protein (TIGR00299 family) protein
VGTVPSVSTDTILFIEPVSGASGDMFVGALLDLGFSFGELREKLRLLPLEGYELATEKLLRCGIRATRFHVKAEPSHHHRTFRDIREMIASSPLSPWVRERSIDAFRVLAGAEGAIHGLPPEEVHFHEVGAVDSIVDIVGTMIAMEPLRSARVVSSAVNVGKGTLQCQHGTYPVPGPAAQALLRDVPVFSNSVDGELTTPTGAALLVTLVGSFGDRPAMRISATGYGAGTRETPGNANVLRMSLGEPAAAAAPGPDEQVAVIEATIDDMSPQLYGHFLEKALEAGALDVYATPVQMKKNRPGQKVTCVCAPGEIDRMTALMFRETTTIGVRCTLQRRRTLRREFVKVETPFGTVAVKRSLLDGRVVNFVPEFEDCRRLADLAGAALKEVQAAAVHAYLGARVDPGNPVGKDSE